MKSNGDEDSSLTHRAYLEIRARLISCGLAPGSRLNIAQLQRDIGVGQAAVREALSRLTAEGLATIERNSGFRAALISVEGYRELADACVTIEIPLLRASMTNGDYEWEGALLSAYHISSRVLAELVDDSPQSMNAYVEHREMFHRRLFSACGNQWLLWSWSLLYAQQLRFRHTFASLARFERGLHKDYRAFLDVVIERDVEKAVQLWRRNHDIVTAFIEDNLHKAELRPAQAASPPGVQREPDEATGAALRTKRSARNSAASSSSRSKRASRASR